jgi:hypothetical protein
LKYSVDRGRTILGQGILFRNKSILSLQYNFILWSNYCMTICCTIWNAKILCRMIKTLSNIRINIHLVLIQWKLSCGACMWSFGFVWLTNFIGSMISMYSITYQKKIIMKVFRNHMSDIIWWTIKNDVKNISLQNEDILCVIRSSDSISDIYVETQWNYYIINKVKTQDNKIYSEKFWVE